MTRKAPEIFQRPLAEFTDSPEAPCTADEVLRRYLAIVSGYDMARDMLGDTEAG